MKRGHSISSCSSETDFSTVSSFTSNLKNDYENCEKQHTYINQIKIKLPDIIQGLKNYDDSRSGKVLPARLHNVLNIFCSPIGQKEFNDLIKKEQCDENGFISYVSFLSNLTNKVPGINHDYQEKENKITTSDKYIEELEMKLKKKIGKCLKTFIRSMWLYDYNREGLIQNQEFRNVLENLCFSLNDEQFNRLLSVYDPNGKGVLNYKDFLVKLGARSESYKRIVPKNSNIKPNGVSSVPRHAKNEQVERRCAKLGRDDPTIQGQVITNVLEVFKNRVQKNFPILVRTFQIKYGSNNSYIPLSVFHQVLNYFVVPMSTQLFKQVLMSFNVSPTANKIQWYEFLKSVCCENKAKCQSDVKTCSTSHNWIVCLGIVDKLRKSKKDIENFFGNSFTMISENQRRVITRAELKHAINTFLPMPLNEEELRSLGFLLDPGHTNVIDCEKFMHLLHTDRPEASNTEEEPCIFKGENYNADQTTLSGEKLKTEFRKSFNKNFKNIEKAINAFDSEESGFMKVQDLRKIIENFCFPLNDSQSDDIFNTFSSFGSKIFYNDFYNFYKKSPYEDEERWARSVQKVTSAPQHSKDLDDNDVMMHIKQSVRAHREDLLRDFKEQDYCNAGIARKEVLQKLLYKYVFRLTPKQFEMIWNTLPVNEIGFLKYEDFLNTFSEPQVIRPPSSVRILFTPDNKSHRPKTASTVSSSTVSKLTWRPKSAILSSSLWEEELGGGGLVVEGQGCSVLTNKQYKAYRSLSNCRPRSKRSTCSEVSRQDSNVQGADTLEVIGTNKSSCFGLMKKSFVEAVKSRWRDVLRRCKAYDCVNSNTITWDDFTTVLEKTGIDMNDEINVLLDTEFNIKKGHIIHYWIFLKQLILSLGTTSRKTDYCVLVNPGKESVDLYKALLIIRDKILKNRRDLRHAFRQVDPKHCGKIRASDFRRILSLHKIFLSEDDFFYVCDYFDCKLTELMPYDAFLASFLS